MIPSTRWRSVTTKVVKKVAVVAAVGAVIAPNVSACADNTVHDLYTALDSSGYRRRDTFYTDSLNIYCLGSYVATRKDITFQAVARLVEDETGAQADTPIAIGELAPGISTGTLQFTISPPKPAPGAADQGVQPFPVGIYRCEFYVDSLGFTVSADPKKASAENAAPYKAYNKNQCPPGASCTLFRVVYPQCPVAYALSNVRCGGFYKVGSQCRGPTINSTCTCNGTTSADAWVCQ